MALGWHWGGIGPLEFPMIFDRGQVCKSEPHAAVPLHIRNAPTKMMRPLWQMNLKRLRNGKI